MIKLYCDKCGRAAWRKKYEQYQKGFGQVRVGGDIYIVCEECEKQIQNLFRFRIENEEEK